MSGLLAALVNGEECQSVSVLDRGLHFGDGIFETIAIKEGAPLLWSRHLSRLEIGARRLGIALPSGEVVEKWVTQASRGRNSAVLKLIVTRGMGGRGYRSLPTPSTVLVLVYAWPDYPAGAHNGVGVRFCDSPLAHQPRLAGIKHLNRLEQVLARAEWRDEFAEGLMLDPAGHIIEGTMSNIFVVIRGELQTPDLKDCGVEGVMRGLVLDTAKAWLPVRVMPIKRQDIMRANELFLTNSLIGVWPITELDGRALGVGPITRRLQATLRSHYVVGDA